MSVSTVFLWRVTVFDSAPQQSDDGVGGGGSVEESSEGSSSEYDYSDEEDYR